MIGNESGYALIAPEMDVLTRHRNPVYVAALRDHMLADAVSLCSVIDAKDQILEGRDAKVKELVDQGGLSRTRALEQVNWELFRAAVLADRVQYRIDKGVDLALLRTVDQTCNGPFSGEEKREVASWYCKAAEYDPWKNR